MYCKRCLKTVARTLAVLLTLEALLMIVMFVWSYFGMAPIPMFNDPMLPEFMKVLLLLEKVGTVAFLFLIVGVLGLAVEKCCVDGCCTPGQTKPATKPAAKRRTTTRKKK